MTGNVHRIIFLLAWCWIFLPVIPVVLMWSRFYRLIDKDVTTTNELRILVAVNTLSYSWILLGLAFPALMGPGYSGQRQWIIVTNLFIACIITVWSWLRSQRLRMRLGLAPLATLGVWLYILIVNSAPP